MCDIRKTQLCNYTNNFKQTDDILSLESSTDRKKRLKWNNKSQNMPPRLGGHGGGGYQDRRGKTGLSPIHKAQISAEKSS